MLYAASVGFLQQAAFVIKRQLIYSLSRCLIITVIWLPKLPLTHTPHVCDCICCPDARLTAGISPAADAWESDVADAGRLASTDTGAASPWVCPDADGGILQVIDEKSNRGRQSGSKCSPGFTRVRPVNSPRRWINERRRTLARI